MSKRFLQLTVNTAVITLFAVVAVKGQAQFALNINESGGPIISIIDGGPLDSDGLANGSISTNTSALNALLVNYSFTSLSALSNRLTGGPSSDAILSVDGNVLRTATSGTPQISIGESDHPFLFPTVDPKTMITAVTATFRNTTAGDEHVFQSGFNGTIPSPLLVFIPLVGAGPFSVGNPGLVTPLGAQPVSFLLTNTTLIVLGPNDPTGRVVQSDEFSGSTVVHGVNSSVPEPGALALLGGLLVPGAAFLILRRK